MRNHEGLVHQASLLLVLQLPIYKEYMCVHCVYERSGMKNERKEINVLLSHSLICSGFVLE